MSKVVLDASVFLAIMKGEQIAPSTFDLLEGAVMSTVNLAEVLSKLFDLDMTSISKADTLLKLLDRVEPLTETQARMCGVLRRPTRHPGLSLGDRACLALALEIGAEVYTADRAWAQVNVGCKVHLIR